MKKNLLILGLVLCTSMLSAQEISENALGLRFGGNRGFGTEISYQRGLSSSNRLEFDLGWRSSGYNNNDYNAFKLIGLYQWVMPIEGNFNWYVGVGGGVGTWSYDNDRPPFDDNRKKDGSFVALAGNIGIEYNFDFPLIISLDLRPEAYFGNGVRGDNFGPDFGLGIRYQF
jgi:hypothetical protein